MALDVYLQKDISLPKTVNNRFLQFEDDGYYWFLFYPFFEDLGKQTNQIIDLADDAFFDGENLDLLNQIIQRVKEAIIQKPESWEEFIGTIFEKGVRTKVVEICSTVHKKELESILAKLENAIAPAKEKNIGIFFFGD